MDISKDGLHLHFLVGVTEVERCLVSQSISLSQSQLDRGRARAKPELGDSCHGFSLSRAQSNSLVACARTHAKAFKGKSLALYREIEGRATHTVKQPALSCKSCHYIRDVQSLQWRIVAQMLANSYVMYIARKTYLTGRFFSFQIGKMDVAGPGRQSSICGKIQIGMLKYTKLKYTKLESIKLKLKMPKVSNGPIFTKRTDRHVFVQ